METKPGDMCGLYERWGDTQPYGLKGYLGVGAKTNSIRMPGMWNHIYIPFEASRFKNGVKGKNALLKKVVLNGVTVQENVEISDPTRGAIDDKEVPTGPLRFQGDHGYVAYRNIKYKLYDPNLSIAFTPFQMKYYEVAFGDNVNFHEFKPTASKAVPLISSEYTEIPDKFALTFEADMQIHQSGKYQLRTYHNDRLIVLIDKDTVAKYLWYHTAYDNKYRNGRLASFELKEGKHRFCVAYSKTRP